MATQHDRNERIQQGGPADPRPFRRPGSDGRDDATDDVTPAADEALRSSGGGDDLGDVGPRSDRAVVDRIARETGGGTGAEIETERERPGDDDRRG
jgi:hypothetical protein